MNKFKIGQSVVCINNEFELHGLNGLQANHIYTIEGFNEYNGGLVLKGIKSDAYKGSYQSRRFVALDNYEYVQKVNDLSTDISLIFSFHNNKSEYVNSKIATFCDVTIDGSDVRLATGVAYCSDKDVFDIVFGERLALKRVLVLLSENYGFTKEFREEIWRRSGLA